MSDTAKLIAQAREYADHRDDPTRGQPPYQSELFRSLADALEAVEAERDEYKQIAAQALDQLHAMKQ